MRRATVDRLRGYQRDDVRGIFKAWKALRAIVYVLPTAGGKTVVAARVIQQETRAGKRVLFMAHRRELIEQAREQLIEDGVDAGDIGIIMAGQASQPDRPVQIASVQTLVRRKAPKSDVVVIDEAHHATAKSYGKILSWYPDAKVLGLTATPHRMNGRPLCDVFEDIVEGAKPSVLLAGGWLLKPRVFTKKHGKLVELRKIRIVGGDYDQGQLAKRVNRRESNGDMVEHWQEIAGGRRTIGYAVNVAHAKRMCRVFLDAGIPSEVVTGETSVAERKAILGRGGRLDRGVTKVVWTCMLVTEGWDLPSVKCAILARPTRSTVLYLQMVGRVLRPYEEEGGLTMSPIVLDHFGNALVHGLPHHDREWSLMEKLKPGGGAPPVRRCPECGAIVPAFAKVCEECKAEMRAPHAIVERKDKRLVEVETICADEYRAIVTRIRAVALERGLDEQWVLATAKDVAGGSPHVLI